MKIVLVLLLSLPMGAFAKKETTKRLPANSEDMRALACTLEFRQEGGLTWTRTQDRSWILPLKKGTQALESLGDVKVVMTRDTVNNEALFKLKITQKNKSLGEVSIGHREFEYSTPVKLHIPDGEDGWNADQLKVTCDSAFAAG